MNRTDIDVGIGVETPNGDLKPDGVGPQWNWASSYPLNQYPGRLRTNGVAAMMEEFSKGTEENPIWLLELAPNTNLAQAIALGLCVCFPLGLKWDRYRPSADPSLPRRVRVVAMGGSINIGYSGSPPPTAEYNIAQNTTASQTVFSATWANATILAPVDTSEYLHVCIENSVLSRSCDSQLDSQIAGNLYQKFYAAATSKHHVLAATLLDTYTVWYETGGKDQPCDYPFGPKVGTPGLFDLLAAFVAEKVATSAKKSRPSVPYLSLEEEHLLVNDTGFTVPVESSDVPLSYAALEWVPSKDVGVAEVGNEVVDSLIQAP